MSTCSMIRRFVLALVIVVAGSAGFGRAQDTDTEEQSGTEAVSSVKAIPLTAALPAAEIQEEEADEEAAAQKDFEATHAEVAPLVPTRNGVGGRLHTFKLDRSDNIVAGVTFPVSASEEDEESGVSTGGEGASKPDSGNCLQVYAPDFSLLREIPTGFQPTALTIDPDGNYLCGGEGKLTLFDPEGNILKTGTAPNLDRPVEEMRAELRESHARQMEEVRKIYESQLENIRSQITEIEDKYKESEEEMSRRDKARMKALESQIENYNSFLESQTETELSDEQLDAMMQANAAINSLAVTGDDVFITVREGHGYSIWRTNREFGDAVCVKEGLRGCCGQMDIDAAGGNLLIAENCEFRVGVYDRDGKAIHSFGERASGDNQGFGSCCNPMNVVACSNGDILTAESSIGKVRRFNAEGEMLAYIGKARIGGGCKHVSIGFDSSRDRYYVQYQDKNSICVLVPNHEAETVNAEANAARKVAEEKLPSLDGKWIRIQDEKPASADEESSGDEDEESSEEGAVIIGSEAMSLEDYVAMQTNYSELVFDSEKRTLAASMAVPGGEEVELPGMEPSTFRVHPQALVGDGVRLDLEDSSGVISYVFEVKTGGDDTIEISVKSDFGNLSRPLRFRRAESEEAEDE